MDTITFIIAVVAAIILGWFLGRMTVQVNTGGRLIIMTDQSDGSDYMFLRIDRLSREELKNRDVIQLVVDDRTQNKHFL